MSLREHVVLMAKYNASMNAQVYATAAKLPAEALAADRGAFFKSILGTMNHLVVADHIWLKRFALHPSKHAELAPVADLVMPSSLDQILFPDFAALRAHRQMLDRMISAWAGVLSEADLDVALDYKNTKGLPFRKNFGSVVMHFFNHQTHHRGQISTLLMQAGQDVGVTDLLVLVPAAP
jgi:uncharacterized damage-inducible protein DinB